MCYAGMQIMAVGKGGRGVGGSRGRPPPSPENLDSQTHSGAFSAQYNDGKIVHQNPPSQQLYRSA